MAMVGLPIGKPTTLHTTATKQSPGTAMSVPPDGPPGRAQWQAAHPGQKTPMEICREHNNAAKAPKSDPWGERFAQFGLIPTPPPRPPRTSTRTTRPADQIEKWAIHGIDAEIDGVESGPKGPVTTS
jgi:hypothetical protein